MISKISGKLVSLSIDTATLAIDAFEYQVRVPGAKPGEWWAGMEEVFDLYE